MANDLNQVTEPITFDGGTNQDAVKLLSGGR
jgi:hypothetical protein